MKNPIKGWLVCLVAACFFAYELVQLHMLNAISPMLMQSLKLSATDFGTLSSTYLLADVIFLLPAGIILDRFSVRKVILCALAFCVIGTFGFAFSQTLLQACLCHFLSGIGNAFCFLSCMLLANSWFQNKSTFVMSVMITIGLLGGVVAQLPFSLLAEAYSWRQTLIIDGTIGVGIWILNFLFVEDAPHRYLEKKSIQSIKLFFKDITPAFSNIYTWKGGIYTGLMNLPLMIISAMVGNLFLTQVHGLRLIEASMVISMISFGTIMGSSFVGFLSDSTGRKKPYLLMGSLLSLIVFSAILLFKGMPIWLLALLFFLLGFFSSSQVLGYPMITENAPESLKGTAMGVAALIIMGLAFIGQPLTGFLMDFSSTQNSDGVYGYNDFLRAFAIFPVGFVISFLIASSVKESPKEQREFQGI